MSEKQIGKVRDILPASRVYGIPAEVLKDAIDKGWLVVVEAAVTIKAASSPTGRDESQPYTKLDAVNTEGMAVLEMGKMEAETPKPESGKDERTDIQKRKGVADHYNYGKDLDVRQPIRQLLAAELEGPSKIIEKAAKMLIESGMADDIEDARAQVIAKRKAKGLPV